MSASNENYQLLKSRRYVLFWISSLLSNIGTWMQQVAQPWIILSLSQSSLWVGLDSFAMSAPGWFFTLYGGVIADRFDKKRVVLVCQTVQLLCVGALFLLILTHQIQIWMILLGSIVMGATDSLSMPAFQSIIPSIVTQDELPRAIALNSTQFNLSRVLGPAAAGLVMTTWGPSVSYGANLISFLPFFLSLYWIYPKSRAGLAGAPSSVNAQWGDYKKMLAQRTHLVPLLTIFTSTLFCSPLVTFTPVLIKQIYGGTPAELGHTMAAFGIGGVLGAVTGAIANTRFTSSQRIANGTAILFGLALIAAVKVHSLPGMGAILVVAGMAMAMTGIIVNSILQKAAQNHMRGRTVSMFQLALQGGMALGSLLMGGLSTVFGVERALTCGGVAAVGMQVVLIGLEAKQRKSFTL